MLEAFLKGLCYDFLSIVEVHYKGVFTGHTATAEQTA